MVWIAGLSALIFFCGFALWKGGRAERWGAGLILIANILADGVWLFSLNYPDVIEFCVDFGLAAGLLVVALRWTNIWLGGAMLLQSAALFSHALVFTGDGPSYNTEVIINDVLSNLMLVCITGGTAVTWVKRLCMRKADQPSPSASPLATA